MSSFPLRRPFVVAAALALVGSVALTAQASAAPTERYAHSGGGYGSSAKLGSLVSSGQTSRVTLCTLKSVTHANEAAAVNLGVAGTVGAVTTSITGSDASGTAQTVSTTKTGAVTLLAGLITADAITTEAIVKHTSAGYQTSGNTKIANLKIAGVKISATPAKNTEVQLPAGIGAVTLNRQVTSSSLGQHRLLISALSIRLNQGKILGLPAGSIYIGHADAALGDPVFNRVSGRAFASKATLVGGVIKSGETALTTLPCAGVTNGKTLRNTTAKVLVPGVVGVAAAGSSVVSSDSSTRTAARTGATTGAVSMLNGTVKLDAITVKAAAVQEAGKPIDLSSAGTTVADLQINGKPVTVNVKENTKINIAGVGTLWLNKTVRSTTAISVYGLRLELLNDTAGLKAGAVIIVGYANAGVAPS